MRSARQFLGQLAPARCFTGGLAHGGTRTHLTFALPRSGQHAVIEWICRCLGRVVHLNHCRFTRQGLVMSLLPWAGRRVIYDGGRIDDSGPQDREALAASLPLGPFDHLLYSIEGATLADPRWSRLARRPRTTTLLILRDPFNGLASAIRSGSFDPGRLRALRELAKQYLRQALGQLDLLGAPIVAIDFNRFATEPGYRASLAASLGLEVAAAAEDSLRRVPDFGGGSSFDGTEYSEEHQDRILSRWRHYLADPLYRELVGDAELIDLAEAFFATGTPIAEIRRSLDI